MLFCSLVTQFDSMCRDQEKMAKVTKSLGVTIPARDARHSDPRVQLHSLCSQWLPLAQAVLGQSTLSFVFVLMSH